jgi:hypothetical protein
MRKIIILLTAGALLIANACQTKKPSKIDDEASHVRTAKVLEVVEATSYTYVRVESEGEEFWAAGPKTEIEKGAEILLDRVMVMNDFHSKDLDRDFETLLFLEEIVVPGDQASAEQQIADAHAKPVIQQTDHVIDVSPVEGGISLAELFDNIEDYEDKNVIVSGEVVKFNPQIMGKNWLHIQDGSGENKMYDLTITTQEHVAVGDIVHFSGKIITDQDFGSGYVYDVLMEAGAQIKMH